MNLELTVWIFMGAVTLITAIWGYKGWETAESLKQVIELAPQVCEICATIETQYRHPSHDLPLVPGTHGYVPAQLVYLHTSNSIPDQPVPPYPHRIP